MAATTEPPRTRRSALASGVAVAAYLAVCLLPLAAGGGLLAGLISAVTGAFLPAALLGLGAVGTAGAWWWRRRSRPAAATTSVWLFGCLPLAARVGPSGPGSTTGRMPAWPRVRVTAMMVLRSMLLFALAALAEIGGAWLVWQGVREHRGLAFVGAGILALGAYGFVATFQPDPHFGRILAAYGGVFVAGSLAWGMAVDGFRPDRYDLVGAALCLVGVGVIMYAPRPS
jgi:small multidrug resistance family-3 protein